MKGKIVIIGVGNLGRRYLQGLLKYGKRLEIYVYDISLNALQNTQQILNEALNLNHHDVFFISNLQAVPDKVDIVIVATTANVRLKSLREIKFDVRYWILEKVLAQSENDLNEIQSLLKDSSVWVNTPRRIMKWYKELKNHIPANYPLQLKLNGGSWGLACNSIHFIDLVCWLTKEKISHINTSDLSHEWHESKRKSFWEVSGRIEVDFSGGSKLILASENTDHSNYLISIEVDKKIWTVNEFEGTAVRNDGFMINGKLEYQSEMTAGLIEDIFNNHCGLPDLAKSMELHKPLIRSLLSHWNSNMKTQLTYLPIT